MVKRVSLKWIVTTGCLLQNDDDNCMEVIGTVWWTGELYALRIVT